MTNLTRRHFVAGSLASIPIIAAPAFATTETELPKLAIDDPQGAALGYIEDTAEVDASKYPNHNVEQLCSGCALYQGGDEWGPCSIFPGKLVSAKGWCAAFAQKPSE